MAIKRVSDLEKFYFVEAEGQTLSSFVKSDEFNFSCIEVSKNKNGNEHSQFQSMRMDICDLSSYLAYGTINYDLTFNGKKTFSEALLLPKGAMLTGNLSVTAATGCNIHMNSADDIQLSSNSAMSLYSNISSITLDARTLSAGVYSNVIVGSQGNVHIHAFGKQNSEYDRKNTGKICISSVNNIDCNSSRDITLNASLNRSILTGNLSGVADKISFMVTSNAVDNKFIIKDDTGEPILFVDASNVVNFNHDIKGTALKARWADLAEYYVADKPYTPGTLVKFGGDYEITEADDEVNAVITNQPGFVLNGNLQPANDNQWPLAIALAGRTLVKVIGKVKKFQKLMLSNIPGVACISNGTKPTIGKALADKSDDEIGLVDCVVKLKL